MCQARLYSNGDATGAEISRALVDAVRADPGVEVIEHALVLDLLTDAEGRTAGLTLHVMGEGQQDGVGALHAQNASAVTHPTGPPPTTATSAVAAAGTSSLGPNERMNPFRIGAERGAVC